jgi:hypothetical protein
MMRRIVDTMGRYGIIGLVCLLISGWLHWGVLLARERELTLLDIRLKQIQAQPAIQKLSKGDRDPLDAFYSHFVPQETVTDQLARLYGVARSNGLALPSADYQMSDVPNLKLNQYSIVIPLHGSYAQIRAYVDGVNSEINCLLVEQLNFRRKQSLDTQVDAELRLSLFRTAQP